MGFRNSGCEHKGSHSREILDPPDPNTEYTTIRARSVFDISIISHENDILGHLLFRRSLFDSILELCLAHHKRLYILQEINQRRLQMKKCFFTENWGWDQTLEVKGYVLVVKVSFWRKYERKRINVQAFSTLQIGLSCHMRSTFQETVLHETSVSKKLTLLFFFGGRLWVFPKRFRWVCKDFSLEPWRKILPGS